MQAPLADGPDLGLFTVLRDDGSADPANDPGLAATMPRGKRTALRYVGDDTWELDDTRLNFRRSAAGPQTLRVDAAYGYSVLSRAP